MNKKKQMYRKLDGGLGTNSVPTYFTKPDVLEYKRALSKLFLFFFLSKLFQSTDHIILLIMMEKG